MISYCRKRKPVSNWRTFASSVKSLNYPEDRDVPVKTNKKRVRGWKRRVKYLQSWGDGIYYPYMDYWKSGGNYTSEQYKIQPWYTFYGVRRPPLWFFTKLIDQFIKAYDNWNKVFKELNEPYDLYLEIHDPNYILSEIECKRIKQFGEEVYYWPIAGKQQDFPYDKFQSVQFDLQQFKWTLCIEEDYIFETEIYWRMTTKETLLNKGYIQTTTDKEDVLYVKTTGDVWIGRKIDVECNDKPIITRQYPIPPPASFTL